MLERIEGIPQRLNAIAGVPASGDRHDHGGEPPARPPRARPEDGEDAAATDQADPRLAAAIADVERLSAGQGAADPLPPADARLVAARMTADAILALAAQAGLGPQGVRLLLASCADVPCDPASR